MLKEIRRNYRRIIASVLSLALILSNLGGNVGTVLAAEKPEELEIALFMVDGQEILGAIQNLDGQEVFDIESLELDGEKKAVRKAYEELLNPEKGEVYELPVSVDDQMAPDGTGLLALYRTESREVVFLFLNQSNSALNFCVNIDGYETKLVTVNANSANADIEEKLADEKMQEDDQKEETAPAGEDGTEADDEDAAPAGPSGSGGSAGSSGGSGGGGSSSAGNGSSDSGSSDVTDESAKEDAESDAAKKESAAENTDDAKADDRKESGTKTDDVTSENKESSGNEDEGKAEDAGSDKSSDQEKADSSASEDKESGSSENDKAEKTENNSSESGKTENKESGETGSSKTENSDSSKSENSSSEKSESSKSENSSSEKSEGSKSENSSSEKSESSKSENSSSEKSESSKSENKSSEKSDSSKSENKSSEKSDSSKSENKSSEKSDSSKSENKSSEKSDSKDSASAGSIYGAESLALSLHQVYRVALPEDGEEAAEPAEETSEAEEKEETEAEKETAAPVENKAVVEETVKEMAEETEAETTEAAEEKETDSQAGEAGESNAEENSSNADMTGEEAERPVDAEAAEGTEENPSDANAAGEEFLESAESSAEENESAESVDALEGETTEAGADDEETTAEEEETSAEGDEGTADILHVGGEVLGDDWEIPGSVYEGITAFQTARLRAYCVSVDDILKIMEFNAELEEELEEESEEFHVDYTMNIEGAARIIGSSVVKKGENLYFAVDPEEDYELTGVYANDVWLDMQDISSFPEEISHVWMDYLFVYLVEEVEEDLEIVVELEEVEKVIPAMTYTAQTEDAVFTVDVPDGAFEEEVELQVSKIENEQQLEELANQANEAIQSEKAVAGILAYDVMFISQATGEELEPAKNVAVSMRFKESAMPKEASDKEVTGISIVHLPENSEAEVVAETKNIKEKEFEFQTSGFSIYVVTAEAAASAEIEGKTSYTTLQEAINNAESGETIYLLSNLNETIISEDKDYTLDMQGYTLKPKTVGTNVFTVNGGNVTIKNGTFTGGNYNNRTNQDGKGIKATDANITLENMAITNNKGYWYGGGIYASGGTLTVINSEITENTSSSSGGGIYATNCEVTIKGASKINNNNPGSASGDGRGLYIATGKITIEGDAENKVEVCNNGGTATSRSGAYFFNSEVNIKNAKFSQNAYRGVEIKNAAAYPLPVSFEDTEFSENTVSTALYVDSQGDFTAKNCNFTGNKLKSTQMINTTAYFAAGGKKTFEYCTFTGNTAESTYGTASKRDTSGAVYIAGKGDVLMNGCTFTDNHARFGAVNTKVAVVEIKNCLFTENVGTAVSSGGTAVGALQVISGTVTLSDTVIKNNTTISTSSSVAGGFNVNGGTFTMRSGAVYNNLYIKGAGGAESPLDVRLNGGFATINIIPAQKMKDNDAKYQWSSWKQSAKYVDTALTAKNNGVWTAVGEEVKDGPQINGKPYATLKEAIEVVKEKEVIELVGEAIAITERLTIDKPVTIKMNGCNLEPFEIDNFRSMITVESGGILTLINEETAAREANKTSIIENWIEVKAGGTLNLDGDIKIKTMSMNYEPVESLGTVTIKNNLSYLQAKVIGGEFIVEEGANVGELDLTQTVAFKKDYDKTITINGSVGKLNLSQKEMKGKAETILNGYIGELYLEHDDFSDNCPSTYAGENFKADKIELTPMLGRSNPGLNDLLDPKKETNDIVMIQGLTSEDQVNMENVTWKKPNPYIDTNDGLLFHLVRPMIEGENLILRKSTANGVYLGTKGADDNFEHPGLSFDHPVATFDEAIAILKQEPNLKTIYITDAVNVNGIETWEFKEEDFDNPKEYSIERYADYFGALVKVGEQGELTLKNITIDGKGYSASAPLIMSEGKVFITEGTILQNNYNTYKDVGYEGGAVRNAGKGTLVMTGGTIQMNQAVSGAGVFNEGTFQFSGGKIINNEAKGRHESTGTILSNGTRANIGSAGGGVLIARSSGKMEMSGEAEISGNTAVNGGGIALGNSHNVYVGCSFEMKGGKIEKNIADARGGGIYIQEDCKAKITRGEITENEAHGHDNVGGPFSGGGIYVNGGTGLSKNNGLLELEKVKVSDNKANGKGGGLAACPSATVKIYLNDGGLIKYNTCKDQDFDIYSTNTGYNKDKSERVFFLSRYMMGGASYEWTKVEGTADNELCVYSAAENVSVSDDEFTVKITGNIALTNGGGIGTNGDVIIGKDIPDGLIDIEVSKEWRLEENGEDLSGDELLENINKPIVTSVTFQLQEKKETEAETEWRNVSFNGRGVSRATQGLTKWSKVRFTKLRTKDADGIPMQYRVLEVEDDRYVVVDSKETEESNGTIHWTITNMPAYSLKLVKTVKDEYGRHQAEKKFAFEILLYTMENNQQVAYNGTISATRGSILTSDIKEETIEFKDGKTEILLGSDEYIHLKGLSQGMKYKVTESEDDIYETVVNGALSNTIEGTIEVGNNQIEYVNTTKEPRGKLRISKVVDGGDTAKTWNFTIELQDANGNPLNTTGKMYSFTRFKNQEDKGDTKKEEIPNGKCNITLKHGEILEIGDLPAGTIYTVKEIGANTNNYTTSVEGSDIVRENEQDPNSGVVGGTGTIIEDKSSEVNFINKLNRGNLCISKIVSAPDNQLTSGNKDTVFTFILELKDEKGKPLVSNTEGNEQDNLFEADYVGGIVEGVSGDVDIPADGKLKFDKNGKTELKLKHGQMITITGLPAGTQYTVTEKDANKDGYSLTVSGGSIILEDSKVIGAGSTIEKDKTAETMFTNEVITGGLTIRKIVSGNNLTEGNKTTLFTFTVELKDKNNNILVGSYPFTGAKEGRISSGDKITLMHDQEIRIMNLPEGTKYTVTEDKEDGYIINVSGDVVVKDQDNIIVGVSGEILSTQNNSAVVKFINAVDTGSLSVQKTVKGNSGDKTKFFTFQVYLTGRDGMALSGSYPYIGESVETGVDVPEENVLTLDNQGRGTIILKHGQKITISDLPVGTEYRVEEERANMDGYQTEVLDHNEQGVISNKNIVVEVVNTMRTGTLSVQKTVTGTNGDKSKAFTFRISLTDAEGNALSGSYFYEGKAENGIDVPASGILNLDEKGEGEILLKHGQKITIKDLPVETKCQVTEKEAGEDGYTTTVNVDGVKKAVADEEIKEGSLIEIEFINDKPGEPEGPSKDNPSGDNPPSSNPPGNRNPRRDITTNEPEPPAPQETIPDEPTPLDTIDEPDVPLANLPIEPTEATIIEEDVPLFGMPRTGDQRHMGLWLALFGMSGLGAAFALNGRKKSKEE